MMKIDENSFTESDEEWKEAVEHYADLIRQEVDDIILKEVIEQLKKDEEE